MSEEVSTPADLDAIEAELDGVERALQRLADDTYWTDEVTGAPIPDDVLAADPIARRATGSDAGPVTGSATGSATGPSLGPRGS